MPKAATKKAEPNEEVLQAEVKAIVGPHMSGVTITFPEITSEEEYVSGIEVARSLKGKMASVDAAYDDLIAGANKLHKDLIARKKKFYGPFKLLFDVIERRLSAYRADQERKRRELERQLQEQAQQQERDRLLSEAAILENSGNVEEAAIVMQEALTAPAPVIVAQSTVTKVGGVHSRNLPWKFEIIDSTKLKDDYWCPDLDAISAVVKAKGELAVNMIGQGSIRVYRDTSTVIRG